MCWRESALSLFWARHWHPVGARHAYAALLVAFGRAVRDAGADKEVLDGEVGFVVQLLGAADAAVISVRRGASTAAFVDLGVVRCDQCARVRWCMWRCRPKVRVAVVSVCVRRAKDHPCCPVKLTRGLGLRVQNVLGAEGRGAAAMATVIGDNSGATAECVLEVCRGEGWAVAGDVMW